MINKPIIIVGTGLAGYHLAKEFRKIDSETPLQLFTLDDGHYYSKPQLSNALTQGKSPNELALSDVSQMRAQLNAEIFTETEIGFVDLKGKHIGAKGKTYPYKKLVFACGASQIQLPIQGNALSSVCTVNNLVQYSQFRKRLVPGQHVAIIGAGLVGCEFANDLSQAGYEVSVIADSPYPLNRLVPALAGNAVQNALAQAGVNWYLGKLVTSINQTRNKFQITLNDNTSVYADNVLMSVGLQANTPLAKEAGISVGKGIVTNEFLETSAEDVYALGDCAEIKGEIRQFVAPINYCVKSLAQTLAGNKTEVKFPLMPIIVKTPACPVTLLAPSQSQCGRWDFVDDTEITQGMFYNPENKLVGFVLTGKGKRFMMVRQALLKEVSTHGKPL